MKCDHPYIRGKDGYRLDCNKENCPSNYITTQCIYLIANYGKYKIKEMLLKIKEIVDVQYNDLRENTLDYNTDLIIAIDNISKAIERELKEID